MSQQGRPHQEGGEPAHQEGLLEARAAAELVSRAVELAQAAAGSDEEFTDAIQEDDSSSADGGFEVHSGGPAASPGAAAALGGQPAAAGAAAEGRSAGAPTSGPISLALRAAAAAVEAAMAAGLAFEGREWDRQFVSQAAIAQAHVQAGKVDKAINEYSDILRRSALAGSGGGACCAVVHRRHAALLLARSAAYAELSQQLRSIPAAQSESRALYAPDPCQLASLGLKDAESAAAADPDSPEPLLLKGFALSLLERYQAAEAAYQAGLQLQPTHELLRSRLEELQALLEGGSQGGSCTGAGASQSGAAGGTQGGGPGPRKLQQSDDTECVLCMRLMYEPVTTPCGHSFCKPCFSRAMDHGSRCPQCRTVLHAGRELAVTITLKNLLERSFPEEYEQRRQEEREAAAPASDAPLPIFVMSMLLPGERMALNIFEPRYRLMVRRCMEGNRAFGMATVNRQHRLSEVACEAEITECQPLPDGRYYIEVLGKRRFRPAETWEQDGYRVARPEYITDESPPADSETAQQLAREATDVEALADSWAERLRTLAQTRRGVGELLVRAGDKPAGAGPEALSFWVANLICPVLDVEAALKERFLTTRSTLERLQTERQVLQQLSSVAASPQGCTIQ
ncbi:hypothetical protein ABPG77_006718 [Micractinium sp. CCAP 211/92]